VLSVRSGVVEASHISTGTALQSNDASRALSQVQLGETLPEIDLPHPRMPARFAPVRAQEIQNEPLQAADRGQASACATGLITSFGSVPGGAERSKIAQVCSELQRPASTTSQGFASVPISATSARFREGPADIANSTGRASRTRRPAWLCFDDLTSI